MEVFSGQLPSEVKTLLDFGFSNNTYNNNTRLLPLPTLGAEALGLHKMDKMENSVGQQSRAQQHEVSDSPRAAPALSSGSDCKQQEDTEADLQHHEPKSQDDAAKETKSSLLDKLPDWMSGNLKKSRSIKTLIRCWVASWVTFLLLLPTQSLRVLGQAAFFSSMITVMIPANMPVSIWLFANFTLVLGAVLGWAWSCLGMKLALLARDQVLLAQQVQRAQTNVASATNPESAYTGQIFQGNFLDTNSTVVYGVFLMTGMYFSAVIQAKIPKLKLFAIFFAILIIVMCTYGPLFPVAQYTLGTIFLLPIGCSLGVAFGCQIFIFPESLSHEWQTKLCSLLALSQNLLKSHSEFLDKAQSGDLSDLQEYETRFKSSHTGIIQLSDAMGGQAAFLELEITYGRLSGKDLTFIFGAVRKASLRLLGLSAFHHLAECIERDNEENTKEGKADEEISWHERMKGRVKVHDTHTLLRARKKIRDAESEQHVELKDLVPILVSACKPSFESAENCLTEITSWIHLTNSRRWFNQPTREEHEESVRKLKVAAETLASTRDAFVEEERHKLIKLYEHHFGEVSPDGNRHLDLEGSKNFRSGARPLFLCLVFASNLNNYITELVTLTEEVHKMASKRPSNRIIFPTGLRKVGKILTSKKAKVGDSMDFGAQEIGEAPSSSSSGSSRSSMHQQDDQSEEPHEEFEGNDSRMMSELKEKNRGTENQSKRERDERRMQRKLALRDPDALPPSKWFHYLGRALASIYHFIWSPTGIFALRQCIGTFALWIVAVLPNTAGFSYQNRAIWAIITVRDAGATTARPAMLLPLTNSCYSLFLAVNGNKGPNYHGCLIFSLATRLIGTVAGLVLGMLLWYISAGNGNGNPYGIAATMAVALIFIVFLRIFAPMTLLLPVMMLSVTCILIVGYSWIDTHLAVQANSGIGVEVAWRRALLVIIGMATAAVVSILPRPASTRELVRKTLAQTNSQILKLYVSIIEAYMLVEDDDLGDDSPKDVESERHQSRATERSNSALTSFRSRYISTQAQMAGLQTSIAMAGLDLAPRGVWPQQKYQQLFTAQTRILESLAQLYASLLGMSLEWRREFAQNTSILNPATIGDITVGLSLITTSLSSGTPLPHAGTGILLERVIQREALMARMKDTLRRREGGNNPFEKDNLSLRTLQDPQYMTHVCGTMALIGMLGRIDECSAVVSSLTGEMPLLGFDELKDRFEDRWAAAAA